MGMIKKFPEESLIYVVSVLENIYSMTEYRDGAVYPDNLLRNIERETEEIEENLRSGAARPFASVTELVSALETGA